MTEEPKFSKSDLFSLLVTQLSSSAWIQLGKLPDPVTNKVERSLRAASMTIDILDALSEKTKGNLSEDEDQFLNGTLSQLKMNYLDELKKPEPEPAAKEEPEPEGDAEKETQESGDD